jgi:hypothetical protein
MHPDFDNTTYMNDIAVLELGENVPNALWMKDSVAILPGPKFSAHLKKHTQRENILSKSNPIADFYVQLKCKMKLCKKFVTQIRNT